MIICKYVENKFAMSINLHFCWCLLRMQRRLSFVIIGDRFIGFPNLNICCQCQLSCKWLNQEQITRLNWLVLYSKQHKQLDNLKIASATFNTRVTQLV